ncbi:transcriptional regulator, MerR family, partial [Lactobacillus amylolyticus DSM 11664]
MEVNIMAILKPKDVADRLGITTRTLQTWDRKGILKAKRSPTNRRFYTEDQINQYLNKNSLSSNKKQVAYARVSTYGQKDDLKDQLSYIRQ